MSSKSLLVPLTILPIFLAGCGPRETADPPSGALAGEEQAVSWDPLVDSVVWAVNMGGASYEGVDGVPYEADGFVSGGYSEQSARIQGSQDAVLYQTYRVGDFQVAKPIPNGTYSIQFRFAEPFSVAAGDRVFSILVEGQPAIKDLDVLLARDGKHLSALDRTAPGIAVTDGELNITFSPSAGDPILSALVVRRQSTDPRAWSLLWSDEFDREGAPDAARWSIDVWPARKVNDEDQTYTARPKNVRVENGSLILEAHRESFGNADYTSGRIHSQGKGDLLYGKVETRARLPAGRGSWSAIWMLPTDPFKYATACGEGEDWQGSETCDAWPNSGEIDIMENVGYEPNTVHSTVHTKAYYWVNWNQRKGSVEGKTLNEDFHTYTLEWTPDTIAVSMDDALYFTYVNDGSGWEAWPFDQPFHVVLNLAVGGMWGRAGGGIDDGSFPMQLEVDYVRVYQPADR